MTMDSKVCSLRFNLRKEEDAVDLSIKQVDILNQVEISKVFHCDGLLLCVAKDNSRLVAWNPYLGQTRSIGPRKSFHRLDSYALGYDNKTRNHKILRFLDYYDVSHKQHLFAFEIYDFSSNSWRNVEVRPDWEVDFHQRGLSLKGNTYFFAHEKLLVDFFDPIPRSSSGRGIVITDFESFLLCFDFTRETIGPRLPLPFHSYNEETVSLSCLREDQLAVL
uniref:F-box/kelch-repeat protein n=1 Tax=Noccaea caerulescens TaxID=107243 RepID=A0A1J3I1M8_NOCCA